MRPPVLLQQARYLAEQAVACEMATAIVDALELVEVEQDQTERTRHGVVQLALQAHLEGAAVGEASQPVVRCLEGQALGLVMQRIFEGLSLQHQSPRVPDQEQ